MMRTGRFKLMRTSGRDDAIRLLCGMVLGSTLCYPAVSLAQTAKQDVSDDLLVSRMFLETERSGQELLRAAFANPDSARLPAQFSGKKLVSLTARDAALVALQQNLTIEQARIGSRIANQALVQAEAVFDPTLTVNVSYTHNHVYGREEGDFRFKKATVPDFEREDPHVGEVVPFSRPIPKGIVEYIGFNLARPAGFYPTTEISAESDPTNPGGIQTYNVNISQQLPWGSDLSLGLKSIKKDRIFINNADSKSAGLATTGEYGRPWETALALNLFVTLPYTKFFGSDAAGADVDLKLAKIALQRQQRTAEEVINSTLQSVDDTYHELVRNVIAIQAAVENLRQVERLASKTQAMFDRQEVTALEKAQVDSELFRVRALVEDQWNAYIQASNGLRQILNVNEDVVYLPSGYLANLRRSTTFNVSQLNEFAVDENPGLRGAAVDLDAAEVSRRRDELRLRPDVFATVSLSFSENAQTFGYETYIESLSNIITPDTIQQDYALTYSQPLGQRAEHAQHESSKYALAASELNLRQVRNAARRQLRNGMVSQISAKKRVEITERNYELARLAYEKALAQQGIRGVTEYELVLKSQDVLNAHGALISALVDMKRAETAILAASGQLADRYASRTAQTNLDRERIDALQKSGRVGFFAASGQ